MLLGVGAVLAFLVRGYGVGTLTEPWNPYLPLLWWVVLLLAVWSVVCGDFIILPVAVFAASFCAQTHLPYLGLSLGLGALAAVVAVVTAWRTPRALARARESLALGTRRARCSASRSGRRSSSTRYATIRATSAELRDYFQHPPDQPVGFRTGVRLELLHLDVAKIANDQRNDTGSLVNASGDPDGSVVPGVVVLARVGDECGRRVRHEAPAPDVAARRARRVVGARRDLDGPHLRPLVVLPDALVVGDHGVHVLRHRVDRDRSRASKRTVATRDRHAEGCVCSGSRVHRRVERGAGGRCARTSTVPAPELSSVLAAVMPPTEQALLDHVSTATGRDGRYSVTWSDALYIGSQGYGIVLELERQGFTAGVPSFARVPMTTSRVVEPTDATAVVHLAVGTQNIDESRRTLPERCRSRSSTRARRPSKQEFAQLRSEVIPMLHTAGLDDIIPNVDANLFGAAIDDRLTSPANQPIQERLQTMLDLGLPTAMFVAPPAPPT